MLEFASVQLFVDRAQAARPDLELNLLRNTLLLINIPAGRDGRQGEPDHRVNEMSEYATYE
jgi:hypothetical protein